MEESSVEPEEDCGIIVQSETGGKEYAQDWDL